MITAERLLSYEKENLPDIAEALDGEDLKQAVSWLTEKDDTLRYYSFLLLKHRTVNFSDVYPYWDIFMGKLQSKNSYQRSLGLMLIAANAKWDAEEKLDMAIDDYLSILNDEKLITVRQCIQSLCDIIPYKKRLIMKIADRLMSLNLADIKETMQKVILTDILDVLATIRKQQTSAEIESYIQNALSGGVLDKKSARLI